MTAPPKTRGGARPGAGRKPNPPILSSIPGGADPLEFLRSVMGDETADLKLRTEAAKAMLPFTHARQAEGGKKEQQAESAKRVASGKFAAGAPPLRAVR